MSRCGYKVEGCPFAGLLYAFDLIIEPGAKVFEIHPGIVKAFNREKPVSQIDQKKNCQSEDYLESETFISNKKCDNICYRKLGKDVLESENKMSGIDEIKGPAEKQEKE